MPHPILPSIITPDGDDHPLGNHPPPLGFSMPRVRGAVAIVPESQWVAFDLRQNYDWPIQVGQQNGYGACNGYGVKSSLEVARYVAGMTYQRLSPWYPYAILCRGVDQGSSIAEGLALAQSQGVALDDSVPWGTINPAYIPAEAHSEAARFKVEVGEELISWDELGSAAMHRKPFNFSLCANNFGGVDAEGVVGLAYGPGNHATTGGLGLKRLSSGQWAILALNSWGLTWGVAGYYWFTRQHWEGQTYASAYCVRAASDDPYDESNPPPPIIA